MRLSRLLTLAADDNHPDSLSHRLRARRFAAFERAISRLPSPIRILDIGGTIDFWEQRGWTGRDDVLITLVNLTAEPSSYANVSSLAGDATDLGQFDDQSFDVAFSNSVIEHVGTPEQQRAMADEVQRVARFYWVQTPNYWFPMEPHYLVPGWQWLPEDVRVAILRRRGVGQLGQCPDEDDARRVVRGTRLLTRRELDDMFPDGRLMAERFGGLVKSWTVVGGS